MKPEPIYVQVPAYRDPLLVPTLDSLFDEAAHPERLRVGVCLQCASCDTLPERCRRLPQVEVDEIDFRASKGANWARRQIQQQWKGERYTLLINSHLQFAPLGPVLCRLARAPAAQWSISTSSHMLPAGL
jgi:hypothetical protein